MKTLLCSSLIALGASEALAEKTSKHSPEEQIILNEVNEVAALIIKNCTSDDHVFCNTSVNLDYKIDCSTRSIKRENTKISLKTPNGFLSKDVIPGHISLTTNKKTGVIQETKTQTIPSELLDELHLKALEAIIDSKPLSKKEVDQQIGLRCDRNTI